MKRALLLFFLTLITTYAFTQSENNDSTTVTKQPRLQLGGYGEAVLQRMFYSDNASRYFYPASYTSASHGRADLPHVVFFIGYNFGRGWKMQAEVEFEHGGTGATYEIENAEAGEYETEIEKGGEVAIEQFWLEKSFSSALNVRLGHIIVPVGLTNVYHMPTEFFTALRPEEESSILPCTWHETGISVWGRAGSWRYEAMLLPGLDAERFSNYGWVSNSANSPYEFKIANAYAGAFRIDNYSVPGLRMGLSGYYGTSAINSLKSDRYKNSNAKGGVSIGSFDAVYNSYNVLARANVLYGHLGDSYEISMVNKRLPPASPSPRTDVASDVLSCYIEAGYDILSFFGNRSYKGDKLYLYGHYGYYNSMYKADSRLSIKGWCKKTVMSAGINYFPMKGLVVKAEYSFRKIDAPYNNEPTLSLGIGYSGMFR